MRSKLLSGIVGAAIALALVAAFGAVYGATVGFPIYGSEYGSLKGLDGAMVGVPAFLLFGSLPAVVVGAVGGILVAGRRQTTPVTGGK